MRIGHDLELSSARLFAFVTVILSMLAVGIVIESRRHDRQMAQVWGRFPAGAAR
jgi:hypothetical protein